LNVRKSLAEKDFDIEKNNRENAKILTKIENVLEQTQNNCKRINFMHEKIVEPTTVYPSQMPQQRMPPQQIFHLNLLKTFSDGGHLEEFHRPISQWTII